ncbi:ion channel [Novosphingobium album (ex Liu et al. 2023)]|uniref:Ion channel n=1 Tax=Novosphingobium album (ex Liu et al. 2023) TaxID=3031130 RepID=A0ABT5WJM6_9SPHN|nr:ion channel [Novosphingobium album (ex Liu et al. 2023)]MDE8650243.1 ion channel [Novosphingobium album (ex Liu et al. 2023)]
MGQLLNEFAISTAMVVLCVAVHGLGLFTLNRRLHSEAAIERLRRINPLSRRGAAFTLAIVIAMLALHGIEIWAFAFLYMIVDAVPGLERSLYFSTISYSTVGYSDLHIAERWRLLGAFESILGMFLMGWSTAFFFRMLGRIDAH